MKSLLVWPGEEVRRNRNSRRHAPRMLPRTPSLRRTLRTGLPCGVRRRARPRSLSRSRRRDISPPAGLVASAWRADPGAPLGCGPCLTTLRSLAPQVFVHAKQNAPGYLHAGVKTGPGSACVPAGFAGRGQ